MLLVVNTYIDVYFVIPKKKKKKSNVVWGSTLKGPLFKKTLSIAIFLFKFTYHERSEKGSDHLVEQPLKHLFVPPYNGYL